MAAGWGAPGTGPEARGLVMGAFLASSVVGLAAAAAAVCRLILGQSLVERATCIPLYLLAAAALHVLALLHDRWFVLWRS